MLSDLLNALIILNAIIILTCGPLWSVYFIKMARLNYKSCMKYLKLARTDSTNMYAQWAYCCRTEFNKYLLLLSINITECGATVLYCIGYGLGEWLQNTHQSFMFPHRAETHNCSQILLQGSNLQMYWMTEIPFGLFLVSIGQGGFIFSMVLSICLMKYIHAREYNRSSDYKEWNKRHLMIMALIAMCIIVLGTVPQFVLVQRIIELVVVIIVYFKWVKQARRFHQTLKMLAFDYQINRKRRDVCRRAILLVKKFKIIMSINIVSFGLLILVELIGYLRLTVAIGLYYGPCLFHYLYGTPIYTQLITNKYQVSILGKNSSEIALFQKSLFAIATLMICSYFAAVSILFFANKITNGFNRHRRTRFTPDLDNPLLIQPETTTNKISCDACFLICI